MNICPGCGEIVQLSGTFSTDAAPQQRLRDPSGKSDATDWWHAGCAAIRGTPPAASDQERADRLEREDDKPWDEDFKTALLGEFAAIRAEQHDLSWAAAEKMLHKAGTDDNEADWWAEHLAEHKPATPPALKPVGGGYLCDCGTRDIDETCRAGMECRAVKATPPAASDLRERTQATDLDHARHVMDRWCASNTWHFIPCDPDKGENPQAYLELLFTIRDEFAAIRAEAKALTWDDAVKALREEYPKWPPLDEAIRAGCRDDLEQSCGWPECKCVHFAGRIHTALLAFLSHPHLGISYECLQTLRKQLGEDE